MARRLAILAVWLLGAGVAQGQTATPVNTLTPTLTPAATATKTAAPTGTVTTAKTATPTRTTTPTRTMTQPPNQASHVHALELTLLPANTGAPLYAEKCVADSYLPAMPDECRCVLFVTRISGTNALKARCPDGTVTTITSW